MTSNEEENFQTIPLPVADMKPKHCLVLYEKQWLVAKEKWKAK